MPINGWEKIALENERRAVERELQSVNQQIAVLGGGHNSRTWDLQDRRGLEARIQTIDARLRL